MSKKLVLAGAALTAAGLLAWILLLPGDWQHWLGFTRSDYFTEGQNYAFYSGVGPMMLTAAGMTTIITGLYRTHNCHYEGCWNIGRHKVNGTPWCNRHHSEARAGLTDSDRLNRIIELLESWVTTGPPSSSSPPPPSSTPPGDSPSPQPST